MEFAIGENVKFIANGKFDYGNESEVVKITKTQIHIIEIVKAHKA